VIQALLVDPVVDRASPVEEMVQSMIERQPDYLGYLR